MNKKKLLKCILYLILFICIINFLANKFYWYSAIWYFDILMHFLGGFWLGLAFIYFFLSKLDSLSFKSVAPILFFVFFIGLGWEVFEYLFNNLIAQNPFDILDTSSDVVFDLIGGFLSILYFLKKLCFQAKIK